MIGSPFRLRGCDLIIAPPFFIYPSFPDLIEVAKPEVLYVASRAVNSRVNRVLKDQAAFKALNPKQHIYHLLPGVCLIASGEARFNSRDRRPKEKLIKRTLSLITLPNHNPSLLHPAETQTFNSHAHLNSPPLKKKLNLISLSYWRVEREIKLIDASLPLRRPIMKHCFKGHDSAPSRKNLTLRAGVTFVMCHRMI